MQVYQPSQRISSFLPYTQFMKGNGIFLSLSALDSSYYRPPNKEESVDEASLLQLQEALCSQTLILLGDFNHTDVYWENHVVGSKQSRRLLESIEDNFFIQVLHKPGEILLDLVLTKAEELIKQVKMEEA